MVSMIRLAVVAAGPAPNAVRDDVKPRQSRGGHDPSYTHVLNCGGRGVLGPLDAL